MAWTEEQKAAAIAEIRDDPEERGYAGMTDAEVAADMRLEIWPAPTAQGQIDPWLIQDKVPASEMVAWYTAAQTDDQVGAAKEFWQTLLSANRPVDPEQSSVKTIILLLQSKGVLSAGTVANIAALQKKVSRYVLLGLPIPTWPRVAYVRSLIDG